MRKEDIGGDFTLTDGDGKPFSLSDLKGKVVILSFGYTHCPDVCPTELLTYSDTLKQLGDQAKDVKVVFVSIDPERDTPEVISKYVKQFNPEFIGLTATGDQSLPVIKQQYRVVSSKVVQKEDSENYLVDHSSGAYLIDKNGEVAIFSPYGSEPATIAADIKKLLWSTWGRLNAGRGFQTTFFPSETYSGESQTAYLIQVQSLTAHNNND